MGMFDSIWAKLKCPDCGSEKDREIQIKIGPNVLAHYYIGDTVEPFYYGDYEAEEDWNCEDCHAKTNDYKWHKCYIKFKNGIIINVSMERELGGELPDWEMIHKISKDRFNLRNDIYHIRNLVHGYKRFKKEGESKFPVFREPKSDEELCEEILKVAEKGLEEEQDNNHFEN